MHEMQGSSGAVWRAWRAVTGGLTGTWYFLRRTCSTAERPLHFIKVAMHVQEGAPFVLHLPHAHPLHWLQALH